MTEVCREFEHAGMYVRIGWDEDGEASDPRTSRTNATTIMFNEDVQRFSTVGDDSIGNFDFEDGIEIDCPDCPEEADEACPSCEGEGVITSHADRSYLDYFRTYYDAIHIVPLYCQAYRGSSPDTNIRVAHIWTEANGIAIITPQHVRDTGIVEEDFDKAIEAEIDEYNKWLAGEVYFYRIYATRDSEDELDSCYGFIGLEWATEAAREAAETEARTLEKKRESKTMRSVN